MVGQIGVVSEIAFHIYFFLQIISELILNINTYLCLNGVQFY